VFKTFTCIIQLTLQNALGLETDSHCSFVVTYGKGFFFFFAVYRSLLDELEFI